MQPFERRSFLRLAAAPLAASAIDMPPADAQATQQSVLLVGDGFRLSPAEYASLLAEITAKDSFHGDTYLKTGVIEELETALAAELGKEKAIFLPTGTLANHLA